MQIKTMVCEVILYTKKFLKCALEPIIIICIFLALIFAYIEASKQGELIKYFIEEYTDQNELSRDEFRRLTEEVILLRKAMEHTCPMEDPFSQ